MKKKIIFILAIVIIVLSIPATAFASDFDIELSDIDVDNENPMIGQTVTISGTATVTSSADTWWGCAYALAEAGYVITAPNYYNTYSDSDSDFDYGWFPSAEATITIPWQVEVKVTGDISVSQYGYGETWENFWYNEKYLVKSRVISACIPDGFTLLIPYGGQSTFYSKGKTTAVIDVVGKYNGTQYRMIVPAGTEITRNGQKVSTVYFTDIIGNTLSSTSTDVEFSNPVEVYRAEGHFYLDNMNNWVGGMWIALGTFTEVVDYQATIE